MTSHSSVVSGLNAGTTYHYRINSRDAAGNLATSSDLTFATPVPVDTTPPSTTIPSIGIDTSVVVKQASAGSTMTAPTFSTAEPNELLVAFIATDGSTDFRMINTVTGGGLTWTLRQQANSQRGTSEIWTATAPTAMADVSVTATHSGTYQGLMQIVAFTNADIGATGGASAESGAPTTGISTTAANSWVWAVGNDWDSAAARTVGSSQTKASEMLADVGDTFWVQHRADRSVGAGQKVNIDDVSPTNDRWNLAVVEIVAGLA